MDVYGKTTKCRNKCDIFVISLVFYLERYRSAKWRQLDLSIAINNQFAQQYISCHIHCCIRLEELSRAYRWDTRVVRNSRSIPLRCSPDRVE